MSFRRSSWLMTVVMVLASTDFLCAQTRPPVEALEQKTETDQSRQLLREQMDNLLGEYEKLHEKTVGVEGTEDLGEQILVRRKPKPWSLLFTSDIGEMWSSNVLYTDSARQADFALTHDDAATASYRLTDELTFTGNYRFSIYRYNRLISQNFDTHTAGGSFNYTLPLNFNVYSGLQWTTVYSTPAGDSVYEDADWTIGVSRFMPLDFATWLKNKASWFVGYQTDWRLASPYDYDKVEVSPYSGLSYAFLPNLVGQTYYRWQYQHFQKGGRKDYNNTLTGNLTWTPWNWMTVSTFCSWTHNDSVGSTRDYAVFNTGLSATVSWRF